MPGYKRPYGGAQSLLPYKRVKRYGRFTSPYKTRSSTFRRAPMRRGGFMSTNLKRGYRSLTSSRTANAKKIAVFNTQSLNQFDVVKGLTLDYARELVNINFAGMRTGTNMATIDCYCGLYDQFRVKRSSVSFWFKNTDNYTDDAANQIVQFTHAYDADSKGENFSFLLITGRSKHTKRN